MKIKTAVFVFCFLLSSTTWSSTRDEVFFDALDSTNIWLHANLESQKPTPKPLASASEKFQKTEMSLIKTIQDKCVLRTEFFDDKRLNNLRDDSDTCPIHPVYFIYLDDANPIKTVEWELRQEDGQLENDIREIVLLSFQKVVWRDNPNEAFLDESGSGTLKSIGRGEIKLSWKNSIKLINQNNQWVFDSSQGQFDWKASDQSDTVKVELKKNVGRDYTSTVNLNGHVLEGQQKMKVGDFIDQMAVYY